MDNILDYDQNIWEQGVALLCGIDEAGRGPLAGPVVAAAVILPSGTTITGVNDSKKLDAHTRLELKVAIEKVALDHAVGIADETEIDRLNIVRATFLAMQRAIDALKTVPDFLLIDGNQFPLITHHALRQPLKGRAVVKGDGRSLSIASASILAKVHRDAVMDAYAHRYPQYGFDKHRGYGTRQHREMIDAHGLSPVHRRTFLRSKTMPELPFTKGKSE